MPGKVGSLLVILALLSGLVTTTQAFAELELPGDAPQEWCYGVSSMTPWGHEQLGKIAQDRGKEDPTMDQFKLIIDRFEGSWAVVEYEGETFDIPRGLLPASAKEGDTLVLTLQVDPADTAARRRRIEDLMDDLFQ